jgi:hypothetical protein
MAEIKLQAYLRLIGAGLLCLSGQSAMADTWDGHLATLKDAKIACRDIDSESCLPYLAQAVTMTDTLESQAAYDSNRDIIKIPGRDGSIWTCNPSVWSRFNGEDLRHLALTTQPSEGGANFYWDDALLISALSLCQPQ